LRYWMRMWSRRMGKKATSSWRRRRRMNRRWSFLTFHYTWSNSIKFDLEMKLIHTSLFHNSWHDCSSNLFKIRTTIMLIIMKGMNY
jgi:hypothetical protein